MKMKSMIGSLAAKAAALLLAFGCVGGAWGGPVVGGIELPTLTATPLDTSDQDLDWRGQLTPLDVALHYDFSENIAEKYTPEQISQFSDWKIDWVLMVNEDLTLVNPRTALPSGMTLEQADASVEAGCISGKITESAEWVYVPWSNTGVFQLSANTEYRVFNQILPGDSSGSAWLQASNFYENKGFGCGLYLTSAYRQAHPNVVITLEPRIYNPEDSSINYSIGETLRFPPAVAKIGNTLYGSLSEAVSAVPADGTATTITMVADETISGNTGVTIAAGKNVTLDLNGHTVELTVANAAQQAYLIQNYGTLTVNDSATGGRLYANGEGKGGNNVKCAIQNFGHVTVNGGTIAAKSTNSAGAAYGAANAIQCQKPTADVSVVINGGTLTAEGGAVMNIMTSSAVYMVLNSVSSTAAFTMTGGTLIASGSEMCSAVNVYLQNNAALQASVNISGGELRGVKEALYVHGGSTLDYQGVSTTISGGTFTGFYEALQTTEFALNVRAGLLNVSGGTFNYGSYLGAHQIDISGGNFTEDVILNREGGAASAKVSGGTFGSVVTSGTAGNLTVNGDANLYNQKKFIYGGTFEADPSARVADGYVVVENNGVWFVGKVTATELEQQGEATDVAATYAVTAVVKTNDVEVADSTTTVQAISVRVADEGNVADTTLAKFEMGEVLSKAVASAGEDATSVTKVEILVNASTEAAGQVQSITYDVRPEAIVTVSKTGEADATSTVELSNADLAADAEFTFELDVSALGLNVGDSVRVTHSWDAYVDAAGNDVAAGSETTLATVAAGQKVRITTKHFSSWTLQGVTVGGETVAIVFAANGSEIAQYDSVAGAISADTTVNGCTVLVLNGTHNCGSSAIAINKSITLTGQSKAGTVLSFNLSGATAIGISASNVTVRDMTLRQAGTADNTALISINRGGAYTAYEVAYSNVTLENLKFANSKYGVFVTAQDVRIDNCEFDGLTSNNIIIYSVRGNSYITNNTFFRSGLGNATILYEGGYDGGVNHAKFDATGTLNINGNVSVGGQHFFLFTSWGYANNLALNVIGNDISGYSSKVVAIDGKGKSFANEFSSVNINSNAFSSTSTAQWIQARGAAESITVNATYNYWGSNNPNFDYANTDTAVINGSNVQYEPYYRQYDSSTGVLSDLYPPAGHTVTFLLRDAVGDMTISFDSLVYTLFTQEGVERSGAAVYNYITQTVADGDTATEPAGEPSYWYHSGKTFPVGNNVGIPFTVEQSNGYVFDGWRLSGTDVRYDFTTPVTSDITLVPHFSTIDAVFEIYTEADLLAFAREVTLGRSYRSKAGSLVPQTVKLMNNITLTSNWTPIPGNFRGIFDGNDYAISGLVINDTSDETGFFRTSGNGGNSFEIKNLTFENPQVTSSGCHVGVLAGKMDSATVMNVTINNPTILCTSTDNVGGLVGSVNNNVADNAASGSTFSDCSVNGGTISCTGTDGRMVGGLIGQGVRYLTITDCSVTDVTINGYRKLGGLIGQANVAHLTCTGASVSGVTLNALGDTSYAKDLTMGGFVGQFATPTQSTITGTVSDLTMTGPESIASGKNYIMGLVSGGTAGTAEVAESAMTAANMTFDVTISGTNTTTINTESSYAGINGNPSVTYVAQIVRSNAVFAQHETLAAAIAAAQDGDTIELLTDIQLSGTEQVAINKVGDYVIDGKGHTISPAADSAYIYDRFLFGMSGEATNFAKNYTVTNLTITGFTDSTYFIRNEGCSVTFVDCTITNNNLSARANSRLVLATASNLTMKDCVVADNATASFLVDFNTNGSANGTVGTLDIDGCLFDGNTGGETGLVYTYGSSSGGDAIKNSTFSGNTVNSAAAAIVYFSGATDVTGCFFTNNTVTATDATQKCGVLALGSGAAGIDIAANVFIDNTVASGGTSATVYVGATNVDLDGNYWGDGAAPEIDDGSDIYIASGKSATYATYATAYAVNENGCGVTVTLYVPPVAQIVGGDTYATLQEAVDAASEMTGAVTITLLADAAEKVDITQKANLSLTIDGDGKTLTGQLRVTDDSANDTDRTGALTITGFNFTGTADDVNPNESYVFFERNAYAHNIVVTNCAFTSIDVSTAKSGRPAVKGLALGIETITLVDLQAQNVHSLAQLFDVTNAVIARCNLSAAKNGININFGGAASGNNGVATISDSTINPDVSGSYGVRLQGPNYGTLRILDGTYLTATDAIVGGNTAPTAPSYTGSIIVEGGFYSGNITRPVEGYNYSISGGYFSVEPDAGFIAEGYAVVANTNPETSAAYPYMVGVAATYVAQIGDDKYETFAEAIAAAEEYAEAHDGVYPTITVLDETAEIGNNDWKIADGYLVHKVYVAQIGNVKYESLAEAIAAVPTDGTETTVTMTADSAETAGITVAAAKNVVLDLNGKTVSYASSAKDAIFIANYGTLTIQDNSENADGLLQLTAVADMGYSKQTITVYNLGGTLTLESGKIKNATSGGLAYAVNNSSNAWGVNDDKETVFKMTGGVVSAPQGDAALRVYQNCAATTTPYSHNRVTISGGTILDTGIFVDTYIYNPTVNTTGEGISTTIVINEGATVNGLIDMKLRHPFNTSLTINGGTFSNSQFKVRKHDEWSSSVAEPTEPMVFINGGQFLFKDGVTPFQMGYDTTTHNFTTYHNAYSISGGLFSVEPAAAYVALGYEAVALADDSENYLAGYRYIIGKIAATDLVPTQETETSATYTFNVVVTNGNDVIETIPTAQTITVRVAEESAAADTTLAKFDVAEVLATAVAAAGLDNASVTVDLLVSAQTNDAEVASITYDVHPEAVVTVTPTEGDPTVTTNELTNAALDENATFTFRLYTGDVFEEGALVKVTHESEDATYGTEISSATVQGDAGDGKGRYVEITTGHFSTWTIEAVTLVEGNVAVNLETGVQYESLAAAVSAANAGDAIALLADDNVSLTSGGEIEINKSLTITGPVDTNGEPLYTIYGKNTVTGNNDIFITGSGTVTLSNVKIAQFGNNAASDAGHAPVYVSTSFTGTVNLDNVYISEFNRGGLFLYGGNFNVTDCYIDCANSRSGAFTKGIEIKGTATGTIKDTVIVNMERAGTDASTAGIEIYGNGDVVVDGCTISSNVGEHHSVKATYGIGVQPIGVHNPSGGSLLVTNSVISCENGCLFASDSTYGTISGYTVDVGDSSFDNYILVDSAGAEFGITSGEYAEDVYVESGSVTISGGTFSSFAPYTGTQGTISISGGSFDAEVPEEYCADGYIPAAQDPETGMYTVKVGSYVAEVYDDTDDLVGKYESLADAIAAVPTGGTVALIADVDLGTTGLTIDAAKNFTLDIDEYDITGTVNGKLITNNGTVTIEGDTGCIYNKDISAQGHDAFLNNGTATINGGWFGDSDNDKTNANAINRGAGFRNFGTATINGGYFTACDNFTNGGYAYAIINGDGDNNPTLTINNADVYGNNNGNIANNSGSVTVVDGTFSLTGNESYYSVYSYSGDTAVQGGTFVKSGNSRSQFDVEVDGDNADNPGTIAVSGGSFTSLVPEKYCSFGNMPSPQNSESGMYTVIPGIVYPTGGDSVGVQVPLSWVKANTELVEGDWPTSGEMDNIVTETGLGKMGANGYPVWQSYVLGLNPNNAASQVQIAGASAVNDGGTFKVTITGLNVNVPEVLASQGTTVNFRLEESAPGGSEWTARSDACAMAGGLPTFTVKVEAVSGKMLRIVADIVTKAE